MQFNKLLSVANARNKVEATTNSKCEFIMNSWTKRKRKTLRSRVHSTHTQHCLPFDDGLLVRCSRSGSRQRRAIEMKYSVVRCKRVEVEYATFMMRCPLPMPRKRIQLHLFSTTMRPAAVRLFLCPRKSSAEQRALTKGSKMKRII